MWKQRMCVLAHKKPKPLLVIKQNSLPNVSVPPFLFLKNISSYFTVTTNCGILLLEWKESTFSKGAHD